MSKFCSSCGKPLEEGAAFCSGCGNPVSAAEVPAEPAAPVENAETEAAVQATESAAVKAGNAVNKFVNKIQAFSEKATVYVTDYVAKAKQNPKMWIAPGAIAAGILVLIIVAVILLSGGKYTTALDNYIAVNCYGKVDKIELLAPKEYWEYYEEEYDKSLDDVKEQFEENWDDMLDYMEDEYGKNIKVTYKVTDEDEISSRKLKKIADALEDTYDIDADSIKAGYKVDVEMTIKGSENDDDNESTFNFIKIGGSWYMISYYESGDEYRVSFMLG